MIDFWKAIGAREVRGPADIAEALDFVSVQLDGVSPMGLTLFDDRLREYLFRLDRRDFASLPVVLPDGTALAQTSDHFLYARCACILAGEVEFGAVLRTGSGFDRYVKPELQSAESLLYVGREKYELRTGRKLKPRSEFALDWMSNPQGWPDK
ncbi:DUF4240 domain-containing protein [Micromonospora sp. DT48]|uniref:DUF4240 domain-containing protein n=1 Tax=Micromonospora sp. DT48 TaxID=3393429 RepID=UPI003CE8C662